jgi:hypothetical protein
MAQLMVLVQGRAAMVPPALLMAPLAVAAAAAVVVHLEDAGAIAARTSLTLS